MADLIHHFQVNLMRYHWRIINAPEPTFSRFNSHTLIREEWVQIIPYRPGHPHIVLQERVVHLCYTIIYSFFFKRYVLIG